MTRPAVIAHRGASGYLPEHTREAKILAYGQGADFLEQDVVATRDGKLIVLHDLHLDDVSDVAVRFPGRARNDGRHYAIDFDLAELQQLRLAERRRPGSTALQFPGRFRANLTFRLSTLDEEIRLVQELNRGTGRNVGIYPEIKHPEFHRQHGTDLAARLLEALAAHGYQTRADNAIVQCFDAEELRRCRQELGTNLRLAQLIGEEGGGAGLGSEAIARIAEYADALAPHYSQLMLVEGGAGAELGIAPAARIAAEIGLELHPYTFRRDALPPRVGTLEALLEHFLVHVGVDAVFCDQPDVAVRVRAELARARRSERG